MEYTKSIQNDILTMATKRFNADEKDAFFTQSYSNFNVYDQAKIILLFQQDMIAFINYLNNSKEKEIILEQLKNGIKKFLEEKEVEKCLNLLSIILAYINLDNPPFKDELISNAFEKISFIIKDTSIVQINTLGEILMSYTKLIAYSSPDKRMYDSLLQSKNFKEYEKIICNYIQKLQDEKILDNELINLLIEIAPAISSANIELALKNKIKDSIDLDKYKYFILNMLTMDKNVDVFFEDIKKYRIQNGIVPENICVYINKFYNSKTEMLRLCNIDYIRHYLIRNGIENTNVFYDELIDFGTKGLAAPTFLSLKVFDLSIVMFHEATHVIQFNNQSSNKNYIKYYYAMLKDNILHQKLDPSVYNRNHNRYLFEIDADIRGENEYYNFLQQLGLLSEEDKEKQTKLEEKETFRISLSNFLNIGGYNYEKGELFDSILSENLDLLDKYHILQIEYNKNGNRKNIVEILKALECELNDNKRSEEEIVSIARCIFGDSYIVEDTSSLLEQLKTFKPTTKTILQLEKGLIQELEMYNKNEEERKSEENNGFGRKN